MRAFNLIIASLVVIGCEARAPEPAPTPPAPSTDSEGLSLRVSTPERVAGSFVDPATKVGVTFDSARSGDTLFLHLAASDGRELVHLETVGDDYVFRYMGGKLTLAVSKAWVAQVKLEGPEGPASADESATRFTGDKTVLDEMLQLPEMRTLPWLSRALGAAGITGKTHPASLAMHKTARQSAKALAIEVPPLEIKSDQAQDWPCVPAYANGCYGMCGYGCSCWSWVCGDCCYHLGCAQHDYWCRTGQWYWCYNITAVVALFGCI